MAKVAEKSRTSSGMVLATKNVRRKNRFLQLKINKNGNKVCEFCQLDVEEKGQWCFVF